MAILTVVPPAEPALSSAADTLIDRVTANQQEALDTMEAAGAALFAGVTLAQREIAEFVSERLRQDMAAREEFLNCRSFDDLRDWQSRFVRTAADHYAEGAARLMRLGGAMLAKSVERDAG